jgi:hypothetical protein
MYYYIFPQENCVSIVIIKKICIYYYDFLEGYILLLSQS